MLADPQVFSRDAVTSIATNQTTYAKRFTESGRGVFSESGLTAPNENILTVSHETRSGGVKAHLIRIDKTVVDAELVPATASFYCVAIVPPNTAVTNALIIGMANEMIHLLCTGSNTKLTQVLNSEV